MENIPLNKIPISHPIIVHIFNNNNIDVEVELFSKDKPKEGTFIEYIYPKERYTEYQIGRTYITYHSWQMPIKHLVINNNGINNELKLNDSNFLTSISKEFFILNSETKINLKVPASTYFDSIKHYTITSCYFYPAISSNNKIDI